MTVRCTSCIRLLRACAASLLLYALVFGCVLDRPLSLGFLQHQLDAKLAHAASLDGRKLLILAGSNGPYSHRCQVIEPIVAMPCVNGGIAVGIGLDYLFARWQTRLRPGDVVYLPMEPAQYIRPRAATEVGPDAAIMFRHDWRTLAALPPTRWLAALFSFDLRTALMSPIEAALVIANFHDPRAEVTGATNAWGDHIGHTQALAATSQSVLADIVPRYPTDQQIRDGDGSALIVRFIRWANTHGIQVIGGLPTEFSDAPIPDATIVAIRDLYVANGADYLELPNAGAYPRSAFFDAPEHLSESWQMVHSVAVAEGLVVKIRPTSSSDADSSRQSFAK
jgi:hypothetical protein